MTLNSPKRKLLLEFECSKSVFNFLFNQRKYLDPFNYLKKTASHYRKVFYDIYKK